MYCPIVHERVWVNGCRDEFLVERADYTAYVATLTPVSGNGPTLETVPFRLLFARREAAYGGVATADVVREVLRTSHACALHGGILVRDMRETIHVTLKAIQKSRSLISENDRLIARWQALGCKQGEEMALSPA